MGSKLWTAAAIALVCAAAPQGALAEKAGPWRRIFDGKTLDGWTPKIARHPVGENWRDTFIVRDGAIRASYAGYDKFAMQFAHLFYKTPFKAYRLRLSYRILPAELSDPPVWARSNSGVMFHSEAPQSMGLNQSFPVSVEFQILGVDGDQPATGAVCTPGTNIHIAGVLTTTHCIPSTGPKIPNGTWTKLELEVLPSGEVTHRINGKVVNRYGGVELDPADRDGKRLIAARGGVLPVKEGYIALQGEGHPIEFKDIEIQELK